MLKANHTEKRALLCALELAASLIAPAVFASAQTMSAAPDWQNAAGGKQQFEVASVREDKAGGDSYSNFSLDAGNEYFVVSRNDVLDPNGTFFSARNQTLLRSRAAFAELEKPGIGIKGTRNGNAINCRLKKEPGNYGCKRPV